MRTFVAVAVAVIAITAPTSTQATSSISFESQGYILDIVVGDISKPAISSLSFAKPESTQSTSLPVHQVKVVIFDAKHKVLLLRFKNPGNSTFPESFILTVKEEVGTLRIGEKSLLGSFTWGM